MGFRALGEGVGREQFYAIAVTLRLYAERADIGRLKKGGVAATPLGKRIEFRKVGAGQRKAEAGSLAKGEKGQVSRAGPRGNAGSSCPDSPRSRRR